MIKNIIFDLSEVIISGYYGIENILEEKTSLSKEEFLKRKEETLPFFLDTMRGKYTEEEYWTYFLEGTNWSISTKDLKEAIRENLNIPVEGTIELIKKLKKNYNLILLSDHVKEWIEYKIKNFREISLFDYKFFSYETGKLKTDDGCFQSVINTLNINPKETIFIDDSIKNIASAERYGIDGIEFQNINQLEEELKKRNISFY